MQRKKNIQAYNNLSAIFQEKRYTNSQVYTPKCLLHDVTVKIIVKF